MMQNVKKCNGITKKRYLMDGGKVKNAVELPKKELLFCNYQKRNLMAYVSRLVDKFIDIHLTNLI